MPSIDETQKHAHTIFEIKLDSKLTYSSNLLDGQITYLTEAGVKEDI